jgi:hypothetical protein
MQDRAIIDEVERAAMVWNFTAQFDRFNKIVKKKGGEPESAKVNIHQRRCDIIAEAAHRMGVPCRIIGLKPRQKGSSTKAVHIGHVRLKAEKARGLVAGGAHFQTENMFDILGTYAECDALDPGKCKVFQKTARYSNGSKMQRITLASKAPGRSGTYQYLLITEAAYLAKEGVANADAVLDGLLKCVANEPDTIIIVESTANGAGGKFYTMWQEAITIDEFLAGKAGYVQVFSAWFEFDDSRLDPARVGIHSEADYSPRELEYIDDVGKRLGVELEMDQVAWMRWAVKDECGSDWDKFLQDYPSDAETAFLKSGRCVFDADGLAYQESLIPLRPRTFGQLYHQDGQDLVTFVPTAEEQARWVKFEDKKVGCRYTISLDSASGEEQTAGEDPDSHSIIVERDGFIDGWTGEWRPPAVVMRNMMVPGYKPKSLVCWWANDVLVNEVWKLVRYWGDTMLIPEENHDRGGIEAWKNLGVHIYQRVTMNHRTNKETPYLGWRTDEKNRPVVIETLANSVRVAPEGRIGEGIEVRCPWIIAQMKNFGIRSSGRAEALTGHDDDVMALAIVHQHKHMGTTYHEKIVERALPPDLQRLYEARQLGATPPGTYS